MARIPRQPCPGVRQFVAEAQDVSVCYFLYSVSGWPAAGARVDGDAGLAAAAL